MLAWNGKDPDPRTYSRLVSTFSSDERLVLYNYSVANTEAPPEIPEFDTSLILKENGDSSFSKEALMSFERDIKRRSVKYKPVHTNHKNYKEVLRDVIDSQMQQYNEWLKRIKRSKEPHTPVFFPSEDTEEFDSQNKCQEYVDRPHSSISKFSNHSSSSHGKRHERSSKNSHFDGHSQSGDDVKKHYYKEHHSNYSTHFSKSRYKYTDRDEDSQESNSLSKVSPTDFDSSSENYDNTSRGHSRDSSIHSSYKYKEKSDRFRENRRHKSDGREWRKRDYSSGSSKHDSKHRRYTEDRSHRTHSKEKSKRHRHSSKETR